jgi:enoyl-CoA hydratase
VSVRFERDGAFAVWTLSRPESKNALDFATLQTLLDGIHAAAQDRTLRAIVLTGKGDTFASGGDLRELRGALSAADGERLCDAGRLVTKAIAELDVPVIAAMPGPAIGGGAELAVACDLRIAEVRAKLHFKHCRMGVTTAWGTAARLVAMVGPGVAARLLYTGHELSAAEAYACRLVEAVVEPGQAVAQALAWAYDIANGSPLAVAHMKALLREAIWTTSAVWDGERRRFVETWASADHAEAMAAFFERRAPVWRG